MQQDIIDFADELKQTIDEIWKKKLLDDEDTEPADGGWAARMQEHEKQRQIDPLDKVAKPDLVKTEWNPKLSSIRGNPV